MQSQQELAACIDVLEKKLAEKDRELEIESALERVRAVAMRMKQPADMLEVCKTISLQLQSLNVKEIRNVQTAIIYEGKGTYMNYEYYAKHDKTFITETTYTNNKIHNAFAIQMLKGNGEFFKTHINGEDVKDWIAYQKTTNVFIDDFLNTASSLNYYWYSLGAVALGISTYESLKEEDIDLFKRFLKVFELSYTRYLDIEQAIAQARESQIEAALERVRSRSMAMQKSEELKEVIQLVYEQFIHLNINVDHAGFVVDYKPKQGWNFWIADKQVIPSKISLPYFDSVWANQFENAKEEHIDFFATHLTFEEKNKFYQDMFSFIPDLPQEAKDFYFNCRGLAGSTVLMDDVSLYIENFSATPYLDEENKILMRFGKVFEQTYTRFLDLQKAEAQTRESQIQLALERVRARTMAMQKSDELSEAVYVLFQQFKELGENPDQATIGVINENENVIEYWVTMYGNPINKVFKFSIDEPHVTNKIYKAWKENKKSLVIDLNGQALIEFMTYRASMGGAAVNLNEKRRIINVAFFSKGLLNVQSNVERSEESIKLLERFASVFDQTYTRFLDLQKAEAQTREAQIEAALERVRSNAMSMHNSNDISVTTNVMFAELRKLEIQSIRCGVALLSKDSHTADVYAAATSSDGEFHTLRRTIEMTQHPSQVKQYESWLAKESYISVLSGKELQSYYQLPFFSSSANYVRPAHYDQTEYGYYIPFSEGLFYAWTAKPYSEKEKNVLDRFKNIIELTFRRYLDLQKAEAQAREAQIEAALERVRARTLAMQRSDELAETAAVLFKQLISLGIEPNRLYIAIIKDETGNAEFWITDEDGTKVSIAYEDNMNNNSSFKKMFDGWKQQNKSLVIDMKGKELEDYFKYLTSIHVPFKGGLAQKRRLQYIAYFNKGFIGMASPDEQPAETLQLLERFAYVFNLTFTRFNDLQVAEAHALQAEQDLIEIKTARKKAEEALAELRATQAQLIQSEKMASLGELTAGIAHEIQNPLNFVNNFSEVNTELISELVDEVDKGNYDEVKAIVDDIKDNEQKILHHGKRADAIVKGMLQHSRASTGKKEPTDINALCDEYLRLAYHGLRAKDKLFNATLQTDFDTTIEKINVVPQDIGRVLLNLFNNAFYAIGERRKVEGERFEPLVSVCTKKVNNKVEIHVKDNGIGIPQKVVDKIFQPFFTTKPTGVGTGLGLSLSYDIIKAHGGEMKVETKEGKGSEFTIQLPTITQ